MNPPIRGGIEGLTSAHRKTIDVALAFLETLGRGDMDRLMTQWHDEGVLEFPFSEKGAVPVRGLDALRKYFLGTKDYKTPLGFSVLAIYPGFDPEWVTLEFHGKLLNAKTNQRYSNEYIVVVRVREGKVALFREFFDSLKRHAHEG